MTKAELYSRAVNCLSGADAAVYNMESEDPAVSCQAEAEKLAEEFAAINESCFSRRFQSLAQKLCFYVVDLRKWKQINGRTGGDVPPGAKTLEVTAFQMSRFVKDDNVTTRHKLQQWHEAA